MIPALIVRPRKMTSSIQVQTHSSGSWSEHLLRIGVDWDGFKYSEKTIGGKVTSLSDKSVNDVQSSAKYARDDTKRSNTGIHY